MNTGVIIGMSVITVSGAVAERTLISVGKVDEAQFLSLAVRSGIGATAIAIFATLIKAISNLG